MHKSYIDYNSPLRVWIPCASGNDAHSDVLVERVGDLFRLYGHSQMDFTMEDARKLGCILIGSRDDASIERPLESSGDALVDSVCAKFVARSKIGQQKYGAKMTRSDLSLLDWLRHQREELMDAVLYTSAAIANLEMMEDDNK